jgi:hypothetical protein
MIRSIINPGLFLANMPVDREARDTYFKILFRSSAYAIIGYFGILFLERALIVSGALLKGFEVVLKPDAIKVSSTVANWDLESVLLIYLLPVFVMSLIFIWLNFRFMRLEFVSKYSKILILWLMFFIMFRLLGMVQPSVIFRTGMDHVFNWLYLGLIFRMIIGMIAWGVFFFVGFRILRGILTLSGSYHDQVYLIGTRRLINASVVFPIVAVAVMSLLFNLPALPKDELTGLGSLVILLIYFYQKIVKLNIKHFYYDDDIKGKQNPVLLVILSAGLIVIFKIVLELKLIIP